MAQVPAVAAHRDKTVSGVLKLVGAAIAGQAVAEAGQVHLTPFPLVCCRKRCELPASHTLRIRAWSIFTPKDKRTDATAGVVWCRLSTCRVHSGELATLGNEVVQRYRPAIVRALSLKNRGGRYDVELLAVALEDAAKLLEASAHRHGHEQADSPRGHAAGEPLPAPKARHADRGEDQLHDGEEHQERADGDGHGVTPVLALSTNANTSASVVVGKSCQSSGSRCGGGRCARSACITRG